MHESTEKNRRRTQGFVNISDCHRILSEGEIDLASRTWKGEGYSRVEPGLKLSRGVKSVSAAEPKWTVALLYKGAEIIFTSFRASDALRRISFF